jgi:hypothetical protein
MSAPEEVRALRVHAPGSLGGALCSTRIDTPLASSPEEVTCKTCLTWPELVARAPYGKPRRLHK